MSQLIVLRGASGVGKSTVTHKLYETMKAKGIPVVHLHVDLFYDDLDTGIELYEASDDMAMLASENACCVAVNCVRHGMSAIVEGVLLDRVVNDLTAAMKNIDRPDITVKLFYLYAPVDELLRRNKMRPEKYQSSDDNIRKLYATVAKSAGKVKNEVEIDTTGMSIDEIISIVLAHPHACECMTGYEPCCPGRSVN